MNLLKFVPFGLYRYVCNRGGRVNYSSAEGGGGLSRHEKVGFLVHF